MPVDMVDDGPRIRLAIREGGAETKAGHGHSTVGPRGLPGRDGVLTDPASGAETAADGLPRANQGRSGHHAGTKGPGDAAISASVRSVANDLYA